jgi:hypothetical protein
VFGNDEARGVADNATSHANEAVGDQSLRFSSRRDPELRQSSVKPHSSSRRP